MHVEILSFMSFSGRLLSGKALDSNISTMELMSLARYWIRSHSQEARHVPLLVPFHIQLDLLGSPNLRRQRRQSSRAGLHIWPHWSSLRLPLRSIPSNRCRNLRCGRSKSELGLHDSRTYPLWQYFQPDLWSHIRPAFNHTTGWHTRL